MQYFFHNIKFYHYNLHLCHRYGDIFPMKGICANLFSDQNRNVKKSHILFDFSRELYEKLFCLKSGVSYVELYEFKYALEINQLKNDEL